MAKMYPERLPHHVNSKAEQKLFASFKKNLSDDYTVIWNIPWSTIRSSGGVEDGQIDFLILHPQNGLLILEVKGGGIGYNSTNGEWYSKGNHGQFKIKNPFEQAKTGMHMLREHLIAQNVSSLLKRAFRNCTFAFAVVFPDTSAQEANRIAGNVIIPKELILYSQDVNSEVIKGAIGRIFDCCKRVGHPLGAEAVKEIIKRYAASWYIYPLLSKQFEEEEVELKQLTEQQFARLDILRKHKRVAIYGYAGTGKTFLAVEQARRLARRGMKVLLTCFNRNLSNWLEGQLGKQASTDAALCNIDVANYHRIANKLGIRLPSYHDSDFDSVYTRELLEAIKLTVTRYDAIIVDEGQDFHDEWWTALQALLRSEDSVFYIFYDNDQAIYRFSTNYPVPLEHHYPLFDNCRNTQKIHQAVMNYCTVEGEDVPTCKGPEGREIALDSTTSDPGDEQAMLVKRLRQLIHHDKIPIEDIVLLSPTNQEKSRFPSGLILDNNITLSWKTDDITQPKPNTLTCCSISAFKGLERPVVILVEPEKIAKFPESEKLVYVALSRARLHLIILGDLARTFTFYKLFTEEFF